MGEDRVEDPPGQFHFPLAGEQRHRSDESIKDEPLVGFRWVLYEGMAVAEVRSHITDLYFSVGDSRTELQSHALIGLDSGDEGTLSGFSGFGVFKRRMSGSSEDDGNSGDVFT